MNFRKAGTAFCAAWLAALMFVSALGADVATWQIGICIALGAFWTLVSVVDWKGIWKNDD